MPTISKGSLFNRVIERVRMSPSTSGMSVMNLSCYLSVIP